MPLVYDLPPLSCVARAQSLEDPRNTSMSISGARRSSQTREARRKFSLTFGGIGTNLAGSAFIEELRRKLNGNLPLVRIQVHTDGWYIAMDQVYKARLQGPINWTYQGNPMYWEFTGQNLTWLWSGLTVTVGSDYGGNFLLATGLLPNRQVGFPGELVKQGETRGRTVGVTTSDATGAAKIYVDTAFQDGTVYIGSREYVVVYLEDLSPPTVPAAGNYNVDFRATEVFLSDYADGFQYVTPWR